MLETIFGLIMVYVLVGFFGPKVLDAANKRKVLKDTSPHLTTMKVKEKI